MKLTYFGYSFERTSDKKHFLMDFRPFLKTFCLLKNVAFKNTFLHGGEHVYLLPLPNNLFLFLMTRSNEIIKRISSTDLSVGEVQEILQGGEKIGFASYIYFERKARGR